MSYKSPVSEFALQCMDTIKKLEASIQFHYGELHDCMKKVSEHNQLAQSFTLSAGKHQEQLRKFEAEMLDEIEELKEYLTPKPEEKDEDPDQGYVDIGRSE